MGEAEAAKTRTFLSAATTRTAFLRSRLDEEIVIFRTTRVGVVGQRMRSNVDESSPVARQAFELFLLQPFAAHLLKNAHALVGCETAPKLRVFTLLIE